jgi:hypothetical protein
MSLVEEADAVQEVAQARTFETVFPPFDFGGRTAQAMRSKVGQYRSANFRSKPALCAMTITASATNEETAAASIRCPATISAVMPVSAVTSGGMEPDGSLNEVKTSLSPASRPSGK